MKGYVLTNQNSLFGATDIIGFGSETLSIKEIPRNTANKIIKENHYSGKFYSASYIHLWVFDDEGKLKGVLQFGYAMNPASASSVVSDTGLKEYLELNRMWIDDCLPRNTESKAISYCIKYIKRKYRCVKWIQSFADQRCGKFGVVYQAANFLYFGEHDAVFWTLNGTIYHNSLMTRNPLMSKSAKILQENRNDATKETLRQFRYIYFINKSCMGKCKLDRKPYPKHYKDNATLDVK